VTPTKSQILDLAKRVRDLISTPERWTQKTYARDANGARIWTGDVTCGPPVCWCLDGALVRLEPDLETQAAFKFALFRGINVWGWNDSFPDHATMLADLDGRIRRYEESDDE
jgi:hypothetical protein